MGRIWLYFALITIVGTNLLVVIWFQNSSNESIIFSTHQNYARTLLTMCITPNVSRLNNHHPGMINSYTVCRVVREAYFPREELPSLGFCTKLSNDTCK